MAFLIPDNLRSRRDVPPAAGSLARLLGDALPDSATVWYEPLFDVDGDRPDLVVLIPDTGVLVVDVLQQKAAAVVGVADGHLTVTEEGERTSLADPLSRPCRFARHLASRMRAAGIPPGDELPVSAMGTFPYIDAATAKAKGILSVVDAGRCLFRNDLDRMSGDRTGARNAVAAAMAAPLREVISEEAERLYRAVIHPDTVLTPVQMALPEIEAGIGLDVKALDREQENLAKNLGGGHRVIRGVAGSGKTVILVHRAPPRRRLDGGAGRRRYDAHDLLVHRDGPPGAPSEAEGLAARDRGVLLGRGPVDGPDARPVLGHDRYRGPGVEGGRQFGEVETAPAELEVSPVARYQHAAHVVQPFVLDEVVQRGEGIVLQAAEHGGVADGGGQLVAFDTGPRRVERQRDGLLAEHEAGPRRAGRGSRAPRRTRARTARTWRRSSGDPQAKSIRRMPVRRPERPTRWR